MGTLANQPERKRYSLDDFVTSADDMSEAFGCSRYEGATLALKFEQWRLAKMAQSNFDVHDEQMKGVGEHLDGISTALGVIAEAHQ